jgi:hypothetical protein
MTPPLPAILAALQAVPEALTELEQHVVETMLAKSEGERARWEWGCGTLRNAWRGIYGDGKGNTNNDVSS